MIDKILNNYVFIPNRENYSLQGNIRLLVDRNGEHIAMSVVGNLKGKTIIYCHGNGENAVSSNFLWKKIAKNGITVITPDYEGCGMSSGSCSEEGTYAAAHAAYEWLIKYVHKSPSDIIVLGYSLGSGVAIELASSVKVGGLILQAPFLSGAAMIDYYKEQKLSIIPAALATTVGKMIDDVFPSDAYASAISCRTLVLHGDQDTTVPHSQGVELYGKIRAKNKRMITIKGGGHCTFQTKMGLQNYIRTITSFVNNNNSMSAK